MAQDRARPEERARLGTAAPVVAIPHTAREAMVAGGRDRATRPPRMKVLRPLTRADRHWAALATV